MATYCPIIYVRGYAMTKGEQDDTTADPFCGFNLGSTVYRASPDKQVPARKFVFQSPVLRLIKDHQYQTVIDDGMDITDAGWNGTVTQRSIVIFRYYEQGSRLLGDGRTPPIEQFAKDLDALIRKVRDLVCSAEKLKPADFRCHLIAHSMGGLVCRAFLQNDTLGTPEARACVDKFFTYATPHNGIELAGINVPSWLTLNDTDNFNRARMRKYLAIDNLVVANAEANRADWLPERSFPSRRVFCLIGTNRGDYEVALGGSSMLAGHGSDGLVKVANASVWGVGDDGKISAPCATAYLHRSHSGHFGIVNSEESYQALTRFLFGDLRVDVWLDIDDVQVPAKLEADDKKGLIDALYQIELTISPRGKPWSLTRRKTEEDSPACRRHRDLRTKPESRTVYLSSVFLSKAARMNTKDPSLNFRIALGIRVPDYIKDRSFWLDGHFEGGFLFHDGLTLAITPPSGRGAKAQWLVKHDWESDSLETASTPIEQKRLRTADGGLSFSVPVQRKGAPSISAKLRFVVSTWG